MEYGFQSIIQLEKLPIIRYIRFIHATQLRWAQADFSGGCFYALLSLTKAHKMIENWTKKERIETCDH